MIEKPTILHSIDTGGPGGAETVFLRLAQELSSSKPFAIAKAGGWVEKQLIARGIPAICVNPAGSFNWSYLNTLIRTIRENNVQLICSHLFGSNLYCAIAAVWCQIPLISIFHGAHDLAALGRLGFVKRRIIELGSNRIVAVSNDLRDELIKAGFSDRSSLTVIGNGVSTHRFHPREDNSIRSSLGIPDDSILVGAIGNIRSAKAYDVFIDMAKELTSRNPKYRFLIAGQGDNSLQDSLTAHISHLGLSKFISFLGFVDSPELLYNNLNLYVSSSSSEGFSISCVEAMASGIPVVATRSGGPEEIITDRVNGRLVPTNDPIALAEAVEHIRDESELREELVKNALKRARDDFSEIGMVLAYDSLISSLIE